MSRPSQFVITPKLIYLSAVCKRFFFPFLLIVTQGRFDESVTRLTDGATTETLPQLAVEKVTVTETQQIVSTLPRGFILLDEWIAQFGREPEKMGHKTVRALHPRHDGMQALYHNLCASLQHV